MTAIFAALAAAMVSLAAPPGTIVGIDLGTTSSAIAVCLGDVPSVVPNPDGGGATVPSLVTLAGDGLVPRVGSHAGPDALSSTKRLIGRSYDDASQNAAIRALFRASTLVRLPDGTAGLRHHGVETSPEAAAAAILQSLLDTSADACGVRAERAVIGVPAHFTDAQRAATKAAAEVAGLDKVRLLEEPIAAALAYGAGVDNTDVATDELVMCFDLGGGTLDVSILRVGGGTAEVLSSAGEPLLGGDDFDLAIAAHLSKEGPLDDDGRVADARSPALRRAARRLKEQLTVSKVAEVEWTHGGPATLSLSRAGLESASAELLERLRNPIVRACTQAQIALPGAAGGAAARAAGNNAMRQLGRPSLKGRRIDRVLRVGAASRMPAVGKVLEALVGIPCPIGSVSPEQAVALGCAVQAGILDGAIENMDVFNPLEAALLRGLSAPPGRSQRERTGEPSGSRRKKRRRTGAPRTGS